MSRRPPPRYVCKRCGVAADHYLDKCPLNTCHRCGALGHIATHCPERSGSLSLNSGRSSFATQLASTVDTSLNTAPERDDDVLSTTTWSSSAATSAMSIDPQEHCIERQEQRKVSHKEIQRVVKHGVPESDPQGNPRRVKRSFEGVTVITEGKRIITTWREPTSNQPARQRVKPVIENLPPVEEERSQWVFDEWYGGEVHDDDPFDYSDPGARYFAWKNGGDDDLLMSNEELIARRGSQFPEMYAYAD